MSVEFITGKPGSGKTLYTVRLIIEDIVHSSRDVITNVALKLDKLNEYLQVNHPLIYDKFIIASGRTIEDRIRIISEDDLGTFYRFRGNGVVLPLLKAGGWKGSDRPDFSGVTDHGVLYVLDEVHIAFNARAWASTGSDVLYYLSQHRKLGDDVIAVTQAVLNVDKQFRSVAQSFTVIRNLSKVRMSMFRMPDIFYRATFGSVPTGTEKPMVTATFTLDATGYASLYDTAAGVGIIGRSGADMKARKKGMPFWLMMGILLFFLWYAIRILPGQIARRFAHTPAVQPVAAPAGTNSASWFSFHPVIGRVASNDSFNGSNEDFTVSSRHSDRPVIVYDGLDPDDTNHVYCTGYVILGRDVTAYFSDHSQASGDEVTEIRPHWVLAFGRRYRVVQAESVEPLDLGVRTATSPLVSQSADVGSYSSGENDSSSSVQILPSIHGNSYGLPFPSSLGGISSMNVQGNQTIQVR